MLDALRTANTPIPAPDEGTLRADLIAYADALVERFGDEAGLRRAAPPDRGQLLRRPVAPRRSTSTCAAARRRCGRSCSAASSAASWPTDTDVDLVVDLVLGPFFYRHLLTGAPVDERLRPPPRRLRAALTSPAAASPLGLAGASVGSGSTAGAVSSTGSPSTSHSTAGCSPCQRTANETVDAGPTGSPWASKSTPRHGAGMPSGNSTGPRARRRSTAATARTPSAHRGHRRRRRGGRRSGRGRRRPAARRRAASTTPRRRARRRRPTRAAGDVVRPRSATSAATSAAASSPSSPIRTSSPSARRNPTGSSSTARRSGEQHVAAGGDDASAAWRRAASSRLGPLGQRHPARGPTASAPAAPPAAAAGPAVVGERDAHRCAVADGQDDRLGGPEVDALDRHVGRRRGW